MDFRIQAQIRSIDSLFVIAGNIQDEEIQAHFSKYLCVKTSGLLENYFKSQIGDYVDSSSSKPTANYVKSKFKTFTNIDYDKIHKLFESFSNEWTQTLEIQMTEDLKSSLNAVISNRNNIAHGNNDSITFRNMQTHYQNMKRIIGILDTIIKK
jgi:hypothetical protein